MTDIPKWAEKYQIDTPIIGDYYRHYRGNIYLVLHIAQHTETNELMVIYQHANRQTIEARPIDKWNEYRHLSGQRMKRFEHYRNGTGL